MLKKWPTIPYICLSSYLARIGETETQVLANNANQGTEKVFYWFLVARIRLFAVCQRHYTWTKD